MGTFTDGVQYNDFKGTVATDVSDTLSITDHLVSLGRAHKDERLVAFRIASSGLNGTPVTDVSLVAYLSRSEKFEPSPKEVRAVEIGVTPGEALAFFKRLDLVAKRDNLDLSATTVDGPNYED